MEYYILNNSLDKKIVGKYPQVENALYTCDVWNDNRFIDHEDVSFKKNNFTPITANAILVRKAKLTDYLYLGVMGFTRKPLVSGRLKGILEVTGNQGLQFYNSPVIYQGSEINDYWTLNPFLFDMQSINFEVAEVFLMERMLKKNEKLDVKSYKDYVLHKETVDKKGYPYSIRIQNIEIIDDTKSDFLVIENVHGGVNYLVSETLKQHLEAEGITGIEYQPSALTFNEWLAPGGERERIIW